MCFELYERPVEPAPGFGRVRAVPAYSRVRPGPVSFGIAGRVILSIVPLLLIDLALGPLVLHTDGDPSIALSIVFSVPTLVLAGAVLVAIWRRDRIA